MSKKILIIEDDIFLQELEAKKIQESGYQAFTAQNWKEASLIIEKEESLDLILLDLLLPEIDGFHILKTLKENEKSKKVPVLVFSNLSEEKDLKQANQLGAEDFLVKSSNTLDDLLAKIKLII